MLCTPGGAPGIFAGHKTIGGWVGRPTQLWRLSSISSNFLIPYGNTFSCPTRQPVSVSIPFTALGHWVRHTLTNAVLDTATCVCVRPIHCIASLSAFSTYYLSRHGNTFPCPTRQRVSVSTFLLFYPALHLLYPLPMVHLGLLFLHSSNYLGKQCLPKTSGRGPQRMLGRISQWTQIQLWKVLLSPKEVRRRRISQMMHRRKSLMMESNPIERLSLHNAWMEWLLLE